MKASDLPAKITVPFADSAGPSYRRDIPLQSSDAGAASFMLGFPALTFQPTGAGGTPPDGRDMNGILHALSSVARSWFAGITQTFDPAFASDVGGYPLGAVLRSSTDPTVLLISQQDGNMTNPATDHDGIHWHGIGSGTLQNTLDDLSRRLDDLSRTLDGKVNRSGDTMNGSLFSTGTYGFNGSESTYPVGAQMGGAQLYLQLTRNSSGDISASLTFRSAGGAYYNFIGITPDGNMVSPRGNGFLEISPQNGLPMKLQAFTTKADRGWVIKFPTRFSGPPVSIIVSALENDWDCGADHSTWAADGFTMSTWSDNTANRPQYVSIMAVGPA